MMMYIVHAITGSVSLVAPGYPSPSASLPYPGPTLESTLPSPAQPCNVPRLRWSDALEKQRLACPRHRLHWATTTTTLPVCRHRPSVRPPALALDCNAAYVRDSVYALVVEPSLVPTRPATRACAFVPSAAHLSASTPSPPAFCHATPPLACRHGLHHKVPRRLGRRRRV